MAKMTKGTVGQNGCFSSALICGLQLVRVSEEAVCSCIVIDDHTEVERQGDP